MLPILSLAELVRDDLSESVDHVQVLDQDLRWSKEKSA